MVPAGARVLLFCLWLGAPPCLSLRVRTESPSGKELGEQLGENVRAADDEVAAEAGQNEGKTIFQNDYAETLTSNEMVLVNPEVSKVIEQTNGLANRLLDKGGLCERRWASECPDGWALAGEGRCVAPASYGGACKKVQTFIGKSPMEKQQIAEDCKAPWPCEDACSEGHDYSALCPEGWSDSGHGFCQAPPQSLTKCATSYDFAEMDLRTRQEIAQTCGFDWKCKVGCEQDFTKSCPEGWSEVPMNPGTCMAPATYAGVCSFSVNTTNMTPDQKAAFGDKCSVRYPCLGAGAAAEGNQAAGTQGLMPDGPIDIAGQIASVLKIISGSAPRITTSTVGDFGNVFHIPSGPLAGQSE